MDETTKALVMLKNHQRISLKALADACGDSYDRFRDRVNGEKPFTVSHLRKILPLVGREDRALALRLVSALLDLPSIGVEVVALPKADAPSEITAEAFDVAVAEGVLMATVAEARADGHYDAQDAERINEASRRVMREAAELSLATGCVKRSQCELAGVSA
jgi:hypothetical protein